MCKVASEMARADALTTPAACGACVTHANPRSPNQVTLGLAVAAVRTDRQRVRDLLSRYADLLPAAEPTPEREARLKTLRTGRGVGSCLWQLLESLGVKHTATCSCVGLAEEMNRLGPDGCRRERDRLVKPMRANAAAYGWGTVAAAAGRALLSGLAWRIDLTDVYGSLLDEAIRRAAGNLETNPPPPNPATMPSVPERLILKTRLCPGDLLTLTAALESLHTTYPGQYVTDVRTNHPSIWKHNPHVTPIADGTPGARAIDMHYPSINRCNQVNAPFLAGYTEHLGAQIGRPLALTTNRPHLYLSPEEASRPRSKLWPGAPDLSAPYWLVNAGIKRDYTAKAWPMEYYQEVIDRTRGRIQWVQIGLRKKDLHRPLSGVIDLLDSGPPMRETILLAKHAAGGLGPITFLQHLMAAWQKPYIALNGGREPPTWVSYPLQHTLHTIGALDCCATKSCWKARVVPLKDNDAKNKSLCKYPVTDLERPAAKCMTMIGPAEVLQILERYL